MKKRALFIDRDGVINQMVQSATEGFDSPKKVSEVKLVDGITPVILFCNKKNIPVIEISNQPGVAKGKTSLQKLEKVEKKIHELLKEKGAKIDKTFICLHQQKFIDRVIEFIREEIGLQSTERQFQILKESITDRIGGITNGDEFAQRMSLPFEMGGAAYSEDVAYKIVVYLEKLIAQGGYVIRPNELLGAHS